MDNKITEFCGSDELTKWINDGCDMDVGNQFTTLLIIRDELLTFLPSEIFMLTNLTFLDCSDNNLTMLPSDISNLSNLVHFDCSCNVLQMLPDSITQLTNLKYLNCNDNYLTMLPDNLGQLGKLEQIECRHNILTTLPDSLGQLTNLTHLICHHNELTLLPKTIGKLISLKELRCEFNKLTMLPEELCQLTNLSYLNCCRNKLKILPSHLGQLANLEYFNCCCNKLTTLPQSITNLRILRTFWYNDNEFELFPPNIERFIINLENTFSNIQEIYNDNQSVHNHNIQKCITQSIQYILTTKNDFDTETLHAHILQNDSLTNSTKELLFEYCDDKSVHSLLLITFEELLRYVYSFICTNKYNKELFKIMNNEMSDSLCKCFTGRLSRLINVLNGFDENIIVNISDAEQIGNICAIIRSGLEQNNEYTDDKYKELLKQELIERGYDNDVIELWSNNV